MSTARTTEDLVKDVLNKDYDTKEAWPLARFMKTANIVTDRVATCSTAKGVPLSIAELAEIETWLSAYYYTLMDPVYTSNSQGGASGSFVRDKLDPSPYKVGAMQLDYSGCVNAILNRLFASATWLGKTDGEKLTYDERN